MEPWDGPACVTFTDGTQIGAVLDRNGLRPARYWITEDGLVVLSSEVGVLDIDQEKVAKKGRLQPGRMFLVDTAEGRIVGDEEIKSSLAAEHPYAEWVAAGQIQLAKLPEREHIFHTHASVTRRQQTFGYTEEELRVILAPMAKTGGEALGSMGTDSPIAALSEKPRLLFDYFVQLFAQVTNPPLDAIREEPRHLAAQQPRPRGQPAGRRGRRLPLGRHHLPGDRQRRAGQARPHQPRRRPARPQGRHALRPLQGRRRRPGPGRPAGRDRHRGRRRDRRRRPDHRALRPALRRRARPDPLAAAHLRDPPPPHPHQAAHPGVAAGRGRRRPRGAPRRAADRLRRRRRQPVPGHGVRRGPRRPEGVHPGRRAREGHQEPDQGARQGRAQGHVQDGHLDRRLLPRRPGLRGHRPLPGAGRRLLRRHHHQARRHRPGGASPRRPPPATPRPTRPPASRPRTARWRSAASTSGAARASRTCSTRTPSSGSSTPPATAGTTSSSSTRTG